MNSIRSGGESKVPMPYGDAALEYIKAGWPEVLPIWKGGQRDKQPMVGGYHGHHGAWPDETTIRLWARRYARANIALRLPVEMIGIDVDHYGDKHGGDTLIELERELGPLPETPVSSARDGVSGIRLFWVSSDYAEAVWPAQAGKDIDVISWYERYVICAPSVHQTGRAYLWRNANGRSLPRPGDLPYLPDDWCEYLVGQAGNKTGTEFDGTAPEWLGMYGGGDQCEYVFSASVRWLANMVDGGSAHDAAVFAISQAVYAACDGHTGISSALWPVREAFIMRVGKRSAGERRRGEQKAVAEWRSIMTDMIRNYGGDVAEEDSICSEISELWEP